MSVFILMTQVLVMMMLCCVVQVNATEITLSTNSTLVMSGSASCVWNTINDSFFPCCRHYSETIIGNNSMHHILSHMTNKTYTLVGDSTTTQTLMAFLRGLTIENIKYEMYDRSHMFNLYTGTADLIGQYKSCNITTEYENLCVGSQTIVVPSYGLKMYRLFVYHWFLQHNLSYFKNKLVKTEKNKNKNRSLLPSNLFEHFVDISDRVIVNVGLHYHADTEERDRILFISVVEYITKYLKHDMETNSSKLHYFRGTYPTFFDSVDGGWVHRTSLSCISESRAHHPTETLAHSIINHRIPFISLYETMTLFGKYYLRHSPGDCSHFCYSYEAWYPILKKHFFSFDQNRVS